MIIIPQNLGKLNQTKYLIKTKSMIHFSSINIILIYIIIKTTYLKVKSAQFMFNINILSIFIKLLYLK